MGTVRTIKRVVSGQPAVDGAGVKLVRVLGHADTQDFDPFLMLDAFDSHNPDDYTRGFPWHPHRGIETITYLIHGEIDHGDSLGNSGVIGDGDCQWMTAGSGIIHQEMPQAAERILGAQLWVNLPAKDKMSTPAYGDIRHEDVPVVREEGVHVRVVGGDYRGTPGAFHGQYVKVTYLDVELDAHASWAFDLESDKTLFVYLFSGSARFGTGSDAQVVPARRAVLFSAGETLAVQAGAEGVRFILLAALPLGEPIAWGGPIVMNTREELRQAFRELDENTFIRH